MYSPSTFPTISVPQKCYLLLILLLHTLLSLSGSYKLFSGERINTATNSGANSAYTVTAPTVPSAYTAGANVSVKYAPMNPNGLAPANIESGKINLSAYDSGYGATATTGGSVAGGSGSGGGYGSTATAYSASTSNVPPPGVYLYIFVCMCNVCCIYCRCASSRFSTQRECKDWITAHPRILVYLRFVIST